jgi:hypothetical protein
MLVLAEPLDRRKFYSAYTSASAPRQGPVMRSTSRRFALAAQPIPRWLAITLVTICFANPLAAKPPVNSGNSNSEQSCRETWMPTSVPSICDWYSNTPLPSKRAYAAAAAFSGRIYVAGGYRWDSPTSTLIYVNDVVSGTIDPDGLIRSWNSVGTFQNGRSGLGMAITRNCVVIAGGSWQKNGAAFYGSDVQTAALAAGGALSVFVQSVHQLNVARSNLTLVAYEAANATYLYAVAGVTQLMNDTVHLDSVEYAVVDSKCNVGPWSLAHFDLKGGRSTPQAAIVGNALYVVGGWGDLDLVDIHNDVQFSSIRDDGSLAPWETSENHLPSGIYGHTTSVIPDASGRGGEMLLVTGGQPSTGLYSSGIMYSYLTAGQLPSHSTGRWAMFYKTLPGERAGHAALYWNGILYLIGGSKAGGVFLDDVIYSKVSAGTP